MHSILAKAVDHLQSKYADGETEAGVIIADCVTAGFAPNIIMEALQIVFQISPDEAKRLVVSHLFRGEARAELERLHSELESELRPEP